MLGVVLHHWSTPQANPRGHANCRPDIRQKWCVKTLCIGLQRGTDFAVGVRFMRDRDSLGNRLQWNAWNEVRTKQGRTKIGTSSDDRTRNGAGSSRPRTKLVCALA